MPIKINSRRVEGKSIKMFCGRPLFCWSLEKIDKLGVPVFIYSSSCEVIKDLIDFKAKNILFCDRDKRLDLDSVIGMDIYRSFGKIVDSKNYILAHCTSPFVKIDTYERCMRLLVDDGYDSVFTVKEERAFCWFEDKRVNFETPRLQTQLLNPVYIETSGAYGYKKSVLDFGSRTSEDNYKKVNIASLEAIDIDTLENFNFAESIARALINDEDDL